MANLTKEQKDELVTSYAALALYDGESEVSSEQIKELISATGNEVEPYWPIIFSKFLAGGKIEQLILSGGASGGGGGGGAAPAAAAGDAAPAGEEKKKKEEKKEEEEMDLGAGMDMFGGGGDGY